MLNDRIRLVESIGGTWHSFSNDEQQLVRASLARLDDDPIAGVPLLAPFRGLWSLRTAHLRIIYRLAPAARLVVILLISRVAISEGAS